MSVLLSHLNPGIRRIDGSGGMEVRDSEFTRSSDASDVGAVVSVRPSAAIRGLPASDLARTRTRTGRRTLADDGGVVVADRRAISEMYGYASAICCATMAWISGGSSGVSSNSSCENPSARLPIACIE